MKTHTQTILFLLVLYYALFLPIHHGLAASDALIDFTSLGVRLNEVFPNPPGDDADGEFIELYNSGDADVDLTDWKIRTRSKSGSEKEQPLSAVIATEDFAVLERASGDFTFSLTNTFLTIELVAPDDTIVATVLYESAPDNQSWNYDESEWYWAAPTINDENATPPVDEEDDGEESEEESAQDPPLQDSYPTLLLSELLPNPADDEDREFIEIFNPHSSAVPLAGWTLRDSSKSGVFIFGDEIISPHSYFVVERTDFKFALNNTGAETVSFFDPRGELRSTVSYDGAREAFVYAWDGVTWQWSPEHTPGSVNAFVEPPEIDVDMPKHVYRNVPALFSVSVEGISESNFTVRWDFGDDAAGSTKKEVLHTYTEKGDVDGFVTVKIDGEKIIKEFSVDVEKYPKRALEIVNILPNPVGADTGVEYITIRNIDDKKIKLGGWFVAIGSHPTALVQKKITDTITLAPGEIFVLTRGHAPFTLPNHSGAIELRRPDGSSSAHIEYTIPPRTKEGALYESTAGLWQWIAPPAEEASSDTPSSADASQIIAQALLNEKGSSNASPQINDAPHQLEQSQLTDGALNDPKEQSFIIEKLTVTKGFFEKIANFVVATYTRITS